MKAPDLNQIDLVVRDMVATIAFYRALGVEIPETAIWRTATGAHHVDLTMPGGLIVHFDSAALAKVYDRGWREPSGSGTRNVLSFKVSSREEVDQIHEKLVGLGHPSAQPPYDTFWGARYAIVEDPDGNHVGIMSLSTPPPSPPEFDSFRAGPLRVARPDAFDPSKLGKKLVVGIDGSSIETHRRRRRRHSQTIPSIEFIQELQLNRRRSHSLVRSSIRTDEHR